jgi:hypothetical protein
VGVGDVACMRHQMNIKLWLGNLKGKGKIRQLLICRVKKLGGRVWTAPAIGCNDHANKPSVSTKGEEFCD